MKAISQNERRKVALSPSERTASSRCRPKVPIAWSVPAGPSWQNRARRSGLTFLHIRCRRQNPRAVSVFARSRGSRGDQELECGFLHGRVSNEPYAHISPDGGLSGKAASPRSLIVIIAAVGDLDKRLPAHPMLGRARGAPPPCALGSWQSRQRAGSGGRSGSERRPSPECAATGEKGRERSFPARFLRLDN